MLFFNEDWLHYIWTRYGRDGKATVESVKDAVSVFRGTQVTDFLMNVNGSVSTAPSKVLETFADKYRSAEEGGIPVDYKNTYAYVAWQMERDGIDLHRIWIDEIRSMGIRPWISVRMNDVHGDMEPTDLRKSRFVTEHPEYYNVTYRPNTQYFDRSLNFLIDGIRSRMVAYIDEQLGRYDVDGLELDFTREYVLFPLGFAQQGRPLFRAMLEEIVRVKEKWAKARGHEILLALLLPPSVQLCMEYGLDLECIAEHADFLTIIPRWETIDTDMPFGEWKLLLKGKNVRLGAGQQLLFAPYRRGGACISTRKMAYGQAIANLSCGADYVYLYNYMDLAQFEGEVGDWVYEGCIREDDRRKAMFEAIGRRETLLAQERSHVLTYRDSFPEWERCNQRLPIALDGSGRMETIHINTGEIPQDASVTLMLGIAADSRLPEEAFEICVNGAAASFCGVTRVEKEVFDGDCYCFRIEKNRFDRMYAEMYIRGCGEIRYAEIRVKP